jgi:hypothetical protein
MAIRLYENRKPTGHNTHSKSISNGMWSEQLYWMKKIQHMSVWLRKLVLAQHNCARLPWLVKGAGALCTCRKECNKYEPIAAHCFWLVHHNDWSRWFAISSPPPIWCLGLSLMGGVVKEHISKLGCEKYFSSVTYWAPLEMLEDEKSIWIKNLIVWKNSLQFCPILNFPLYSARRWERVGGLSPKSW